MGPICPTHGRCDQAPGHHRGPVAKRLFRRWTWKKILGENTLRVMAEVERVSRELKLNAEELTHENSGSSFEKRKRSEMRKLAILSLPERRNCLASRSGKLPRRPPPAQNGPQLLKSARRTKDGDSTNLRSRFAAPALLKGKRLRIVSSEIVTTRGEFTVSVTRAWAPIGADRFYIW